MHSPSYLITRAISNRSPAGACWKINRGKPHYTAIRLATTAAHGPAEEHRRERAHLRRPVFRYYAIAAALMIVKMMSQGWITVFRMIKVKGGYRYPEDAQRSPANPHPSPEQLLPNEYVERSRRMHGNDVENIPLFSS